MSPSLRPGTPGRSPAPLGRRIRYAFDSTLSSGSGAMVAWLGLLAAALVLFAGAVIVATNVKQVGQTDPLGFREAVWESLMRTLDPGTMGNDTGWGFRLVMLGVTIGGILVVATLIGVVASGIETRLAELRKGRSVVIESDHTLILGWSPEIFRIILELSHAKIHHHRPRIVVVADRDKIEMEDEIRTALPDLGRIRVVCRTGNPLVPADLALGNPDEARAIIVLTPPGPDGDAHVVKTLLALINNPNRRPEPYHVVAELRDPRDLRVAGIVGKTEVELIATDTVIAHITAQTCRQPGLSVVYMELLDFSGHELYFAHLDDVAGLHFGDVVGRYEASIIIGLRSADGTIHVAPPLDTVVAADDEVLAIAPDNLSIGGPPIAAVDFDDSVLVARPSEARPPERTLVLNWNTRGPLMVRELDETVARGSTVHVVVADDEFAVEIAEVSAECVNQAVTFEIASPIERDVLVRLLVTEQFDHVVILATGEDDPQEADTHALVSLLHVRDILETTGKRLSVVTEILERGNRELAKTTAVDDFIVSDEVISRMVTQIAQNGDLHQVLTMLFASHGVQIVLHPVVDYAKCSTPVPFAAVMEAAHRRGEIAIGYRRSADADRAERDFGVVVNPRKSETVVFAPDDRIVALVP